MISAIPLDPDGEQARRLLTAELADPAYRIAEPTWFDRTAQAIRDGIAALFSGSVGPEWATVVAVIIGAALLALVVIAIVLWGLPARRSSAASTPGDLFGDQEQRSAAELRQAAADAAGRSDWDEAIVLRLRAAARGLDERGILDLPPGTTAQQFALRARELSAAAGPDLAAGAAAFDSVRYLGGRGTRAGYAAVAAADDALAALTPQLSTASTG